MAVGRKESWLLVKKHRNFHSTTGIHSTVWLVANQHISYMVQHSVTPCLNDAKDIRCLWKQKEWLFKTYVVWAVLKDVAGHVVLIDKRKQASQVILDERDVGVGDQIVERSSWQKQAFFRITQVRSKSFTRTKHKCIATVTVRCGVMFGPGKRT